MELYDALGSQYDEMIDWESRYQREAPFFRSLFARNSVRRVIDAACGTGMHAKWFAKWGLDVVAADPSPAMVSACRENTKGLRVFVLQAAFEELGEMVGEPADAVVCLGNSLPHVLDEKGLETALLNFRAVLRPSGILVVHNNNYDAIVGKRQRFMPLAVRRTSDGQKLFLRFFDIPENRGPLTFNVVVLKETADGWSMDVQSAKHRPITHIELKDLLDRTGFDLVSLLGSYDGQPFDPSASDNLIAVAKSRG